MDLRKLEAKMNKFMISLISDQIKEAVTYKLSRSFDKCVMKLLKSKIDKL